MSLVVAAISLEQELSKEIALKYVKNALTFIRSHSKMRIIVCENDYDLSIVLKAENSEYLQVYTHEINQVLVPIIEIETALEELVEKKVLSNIEHVLLTAPESRKHDRARDDWTDLVNNQSGAERLVDALEAEGIFYE